MATPTTSKKYFIKEFMLHFRLDYFSDYEEHSENNMQTGMLQSIYTKSVLKSRTNGLEIRQRSDPYSLYY